MHLLACCIAGLLERPIVLEEGQKREKKKVQRLEFSPGESKQRRVSLEEGSGTKLGDIPRVEFQLQKTHWDDLKPLHRILYDRVASVSTTDSCLLLYMQLSVASYIQLCFNKHPVVILTRTLLIRFDNFWNRYTFHSNK